MANKINNMDSELIKNLASFAVLKGLCNSGLDIYDVIAEFICQIFVDNNIVTPLPINKIGDYLTSDYGLTLPLTVINTASKRSPDLEPVDKNVMLKSKKNRKSITPNIAEEKLFSQNLFEDLYRFVENDEKTKLSSGERAVVEKSFYDYLLSNEIPTAYSKSIYKFILSRQKDEAFTARLNRIAEGYIGYKGLASESIGNIQKLVTSDLVIYLETEILFDAVGYNGPIHKRIFEEFKCYVDKINANSQKKTHKNIIHLRYLDETNDEINAYFYTAEKILEGQDIVRPGRPAMSYICSQSHDVSGVYETRTKFQKQLKDNNIVLDDKAAFYSQMLQQDYSLAIDREAITRDLQKFSDEYEQVNSDIDLLEHIKVRRGHRSRQSFSTIGHILLTSSSAVHTLARNPVIKKNKEVPLATHISFLTNKFWLACGGMQADDNQLYSIDIINRVRLVLSSQVNESTYILYNELKSRVKNGELTQEIAKEVTAQLRMRTTSPEEIEDATIVEDIYPYINENSIGQTIENLKGQAAYNQQLQERLNYLEERPYRIILYVVFFIIWAICWLIIAFLFINGMIAIINDFNDCCSSDGFDIKSFVHINWVKKITVFVPLIALSKNCRRVLSYKFFMKRNVDAYLEKLIIFRNKYFNKK